MTLFVYCYDSLMTPGSQIVVIGCVLLFTYSLDKNNLGATGIQVLAGDLQHCTNLQKLE